MTCYSIEARDQIFEKGYGFCLLLEKGEQNLIKT